MNFNNKSYSKDVVAEVQSVQKGVDFPIINGGFPTFNTCGHTTIDMSNVEKTEPTKMHTLSIKLADDTYLTLCVMPMFDGNYINIDTRFHTENENRSQKLIHFGVGENGRMNDTHVNDLRTTALISEVKKVVSENE